MTDLEMTTTCRQCGAEHRPAHADYVREKWRICRRCRDGPREYQESKPDTERRSGAPDAPQRKPRRKGLFP